MQTRHIQTDGLRQQILEAGSGPLVLLIHGFPELGISWRDLQAYAGSRASRGNQLPRGFQRVDRVEVT